MRLPQELIDEIIGEFDIPGKPNFREIRKTLKSCALVARSFARPSQMLLFSRIAVDDYAFNKCRYDQDPYDYEPTSLSLQLAKLLETSPHLASYIRTLDLDFALYSMDGESVPKILSVVTRLHTLTLTSCNECDSLNPFHDFIAMGSLPCLQRLELRDYELDSPVELELLLSRIPSLRELTLRGIDFSNKLRKIERDNDCVDKKSSGAGRVLLDALTLVYMTQLDVEQMLDFFTTVDIKHLKSLSLTGWPVPALLRANAGSIQTVKIVECYFEDEEDEIDEDEIDAILACDNRLSFIDIEGRDAELVHLSLYPLGRLQNLKVLKTIRISFSHLLPRATFVENAHWEQLDALLMQVHSDVEVNMHVGFDSRTRAGDVELVRKCLPLLSGRGLLHVHIRR
ncbi:hypothetical protein B0H11DRAFT_2135344 [Mycena galericulata]|nr:hypothetical protein B0H11DRAFT_2135344 [Mycena galericulata]